MGRLRCRSRQQLRFRHAALLQRKRGQLGLADCFIASQDRSKKFHSEILARTAANNAGDSRVSGGTKLDCNRISKLQVDPCVESHPALAYLCPASFGTTVPDCPFLITTLSEQHLKRLMVSYVSYYHEDRTHCGLQKQTPNGRIRRSPQGEVTARPRLGGLHHRYERALPELLNSDSKSLKELAPHGGRIAASSVGATARDKPLPPLHQGKTQLLMI